MNLNQIKKGLLHPRLAARFLFNRGSKQLQEVKGQMYELFYKAKYRDSYTPVNNLIRIDPNEVDYFLSPRPVNNNRISWVIQGEWDQRKLSMSELYPHYSDGDRKYELRNNHPPSRIKFERSEHYNSFREHFLKGVPWKETEFYNRLTTTPKLNTKYGATIGEIEDRLSYNDDIFSSIKSNGYRAHATNRQKIVNEVPVFIGRGGEIIQGRAGLHRFTISRLLNLKSIPVWVWGRHRKWQELRSDISGGNVDADELGILDHPDIEILVG